MSQERPGHTLQATALINEAYLKLLGQERYEWHNAHTSLLFARKSCVIF
jgi:hypothetical protein